MTDFGCGSDPCLSSNCVELQISEFLAPEIRVTIALMKKGTGT